ncbi:hypothetical protein, partial [Klebsiella pneumoniae]|uniref:NADH-quinone oxidoreductase subunit D-related protein n=1 Tax=Klebsiella pneumoniae TaxID=573 RepID=UPI0021B1370C
VMLKVEELRQSLRILQQCLDNMPEGPFKADHTGQNPNRGFTNGAEVEPSVEGKVLLKVFQHAGLLSAAAIMNAVILTAVLSAGNSGMYASTRML